LPQKRLDEVTKWWNKAFHRKNEGFYMNLVNNHQWQTPETISEKEYLESFYIVQPILCILTTFYPIYRKIHLK
jgi:hypothetical protein